MTHCLLRFPSQSGSNPQRLRGTQGISVKRWPTSGTQSQGPPQECREGGPPAPTPCLLLSVLMRMGNSLGFPSHSSLCLPASTYKKKKYHHQQKKQQNTQCWHTERTEEMLWGVQRAKATSGAAARVLQLCTHSGSP